jgi:hypothetical protein
VAAGRQFFTDDRMAPAATGVVGGGDLVGGTVAVLAIEAGVDVLVRVNSSVMALETQGCLRAVCLRGLVGEDRSVQMAVGAVKKPVGG